MNEKECEIKRWNAESESGKMLETKEHTEKDTQYRAKNAKATREREQRKGVTKSFNASVALEWKTGHE